MKTLNASSLWAVAALAVLPAILTAQLAGLADSISIRSEGHQVPILGGDAPAEAAKPTAEAAKDAAAEAAKPAAEAAKDAAEAAKDAAAEVAEAAKPVADATKPAAEAAKPAPAGEPPAPPEAAKPAAEAVKPVAEAAKDAAAEVAEAAKPAADAAKPATAEAAKPAAEAAKDTASKSAAAAAAAKPAAPAAPVEVRADSARTEESIFSLKPVAKPATAAKPAAASKPAAAAAPAAPVELRDESSRTPWHFSVGYEMRSPVKAKFQFVPSRYKAGKPKAFSSSYQSQSAASSSASRGDYDDGYVHPDSGTSVDGDTTAWSADNMSQYSASDETITFSTTYSVGSTSLKNPPVAEGENEERFSGITFDFSRDIWSSGAFAIRGAVGFSHDSRKDMLEHTHAFPLGSSSLAVYQRQDIYDVTYWAGVPPDTLQNQGGDDEMGAEIPATPAETRDVRLGGGGSSVYRGGSSFAMDYRMTELRFALEPEYAIASWLAIYGQAGVAIGKGKASWEVSSWFSTNGSKKNYSESGDTKEKFVDGFVGLGLRIMPIENLGVSIFGDYRFGTGEIEVEADPYTCKLETGKLRYGAALTLAF